MGHLILISVVSGTLLAGCCAPRQAAATSQWEYKVINAQLYETLQAELTEASADGWEVVSMVNRDLNATVVLKRPKQ